MLDTFFNPKYPSLMPRNSKDSELQKLCYEAVAKGNDTIDLVWLEVIETKRTARSTVKRYLENLVHLGAVTVNREYHAHRYSVTGDIKDIVPELEYYLPRVDEYHAQKVPQLVNAILEAAYKNGENISKMYGGRDGRHFILLALAARSEDPRHLQALVKEVVKATSAAFMDYRLFDTIGKRGIDKTRDAKRLFNLGDMSAHEAAVAFDNLFAETFSPSPQTNT